MKAKRWNYETRTYDDYELPEGAHVIPKIKSGCKVVCACCGITMPIEVAYTSREIHTKLGLGYPVCTDCFDVECVKHQIYYGSY